MTETIRRLKSLNPPMCDFCDQTAVLVETTRRPVSHGPDREYYCDACWAKRRQSTLEVTMMSEPVYDFWKHESGDVYAIRWADDHVTGCVGPLAHDEQRPARLPDFHYEDRPEDAAWADETQGAFILVERDGHDD